MSKAANLGIFKAAEIGNEKISVSHIQFADDTMFIGAASIENAWVMRRILRNFELLSGLKVNYEKCSLSGVNVDTERLGNMAEILGCKIGSIPFSYLGIKVGINHKKTDEWKGVVQKIRRRLKRWENKKVSMGGKITLLNSVLSSIPTYYLSFYAIPKKITREIVSLQRNFLWGGGDNTRKVAWIEWKRICREKFQGGLGVRDVRLFNKTLLGKWGWRFLVEGESMWSRIVKSRYGESWGEGCGRLPTGRRGKVSLWWKDILEVTENGNGGWFDECLEKILGDGNKTAFWEENWTGEGPLRDIFPRLYHNNLDKERKLGEIGTWEGTRWTWSWRWRRPLFERELELFNAFLRMVDRYNPINGMEDTWKWRFSVNGRFSTKATYMFLLNREHVEPINEEKSRGFKLIWKNFAPTKVKAHAWRLLWDRLPTRSNLKRRGIMQENENMSCPFCGETEETNEHLFFECSTSYAVWMKCLDWLHSPTVLHSNSITNLLLFGSILRGKLGKKAAVCVWLGVVWMLWKSRNNLIFKSESFVLSKFMDELKSRLWSWFTTMVNTCTDIPYNAWTVNPRPFLEDLV